MVNKARKFKQNPHGLIIYLYKLIRKGQKQKEKYVILGFSLQQRCDTNIINVTRILPKKYETQTPYNNIHTEQRILNNVSEQFCRKKYKKEINKF